MCPYDGNRKPSNFSQVKTSSCGSIKKDDWIVTFKPILFHSSPDHCPQRSEISYFLSLAMSLLQMAEIICIRHLLKSEYITDLDWDTNTGACALKCNMESQLNILKKAFLYGINTLCDYWFELGRYWIEGGKGAIWK